LTVPGTESHNPALSSDPFVVRNICRKAKRIIHASVLALQRSSTTAFKGVHADGYGVPISQGSIDAFFTKIQHAPVHVYLPKTTLQVRSIAIDVFRRFCGPLLHRLEKVFHRYLVNIDIDTVDVVRAEKFKVGFKVDFHVCLTFALL
jgi:hypothetical protein